MSAKGNAALQAISLLLLILGGGFLALAVESALTTGHGLGAGWPISFGCLMFGALLYVQSKDQP